MPAGLSRARDIAAVVFASVTAVGIVCTAPAATAESLVWHICQPFEKRVTCVVDGDTLWYRGTKIRLTGIDAPEVEGQCRAERHRAAEATRALTDLLNTGLRRMAFDGQDRYGRALARLWVASGEIGPAMIAAGHAVPFGPRHRNAWCGS